MNSGGIGKARSAAEKAANARQHDSYVVHLLNLAWKNQTSIPVSSKLGEEPHHARLRELPAVLVVAEGKMARLFYTETGTYSEVMTRQEAINAADV